MLGKLALRNAKRSVKDYSVYLLTVTIAFSLMYAFNMVMLSKDIKEMNQMMAGLSLTIAFISVIVIAVIEWLVHYMNRFMLEKRSRELGTYMLLGISSRKISRMVMLENMMMGAAAFFAGLIAGTFLYQILVIIIMKLFEIRYSIQADVSLPAILLTLFYAILIYAFSMLRMQKRLKKMKICHFIYAEKQNEAAVVTKKESHWILCLGSALLLAAGCGIQYLIFHNTSLLSMPLMLIGFVLMIGGLYGTYISLAAFLIKVFLGKDKRKFSGDNLFIFRNLSAKLKTMSVTMGTLSMLLTLTLACIQSATLFHRFYERSALNRCSFDVQISAEDTLVFSDLEAYFEKARGIEASLQVPVYSCGQAVLYHALEQQSYAMEDYAISYSDYKKLRKMLGYEPVSLKDGHYILHSHTRIRNVAKEKENLDYMVNGTTLKLQDVYDEPLSQSGFIGVGCIIVLPDRLTAGLQRQSTTLVINTREEVAANDCQYLSDFFSKALESEGVSDAYWDTKRDAISNSRSAIIIFGFGLYYTGLIFICTAAAVLTVQQLSDASKYRFRYRILSMLGVKERKIDRLIFKQLLLYFGVPLLLPIPLSIFISLCIRNILLDMITPGFFWMSVSTGLGLFLLIYVLYFGAAYAGCKRSAIKPAKG